MNPKLFLSRKDVEEAIEFARNHWRYKNSLGRADSLENLDKELQGKIRVALIKSAPKNGVFCENTNTPRKVVEPHLNNKYILHLDVKHYYESISFALVEKFLKRALADEELDFAQKLYFDKTKHLRRGLYASPVISEIVGIKLDAIMRGIFYDLRLIQDVTYTRFYDDILLSGVGKERLHEIELSFEEKILRLDLELNHRKTKIAETSTAKLLGLRIHKQEICTTKKFRKKTRLRIYYAINLVNKWNNGQYADIEHILNAIGAVIGSCRYIIDSSTMPQPKYEKILDIFVEQYEFFVDLSPRMDSENQPLLDELGGEKLALKQIKRRRKKWHYLDEDEKEDLSKIVRCLRGPNNKD